MLRFAKKFPLTNRLLEYKFVALIHKKTEVSDLSDTSVNCFILVETIGIEPTTF